MGRLQSHVYSVSDLLNMAAKGEPCTAAEIGVYRGITSSHLLRTYQNLTLYMVDPWCSFPADSEYVKTGDPLPLQSPEEIEDNYSESLRITDFAKDRRHVVRKLSTDAIIDVPDSLDLVFIDAEHSYSAVKRDIELWWPKVRPGGILCGHDYTRRYRGVIRAVDEWVKNNSVTFNYKAGTVWWWYK